MPAILSRPQYVKLYTKYCNFYQISLHFDFMGLIDKHWFRIVTLMLRGALSRQMSCHYIVSSRREMLNQRLYQNFMNIIEWNLTRFNSNAFINVLTHKGRDKIAAISQMTQYCQMHFSMKIYECCLRFHWSLFLRFEFTIFQHWFR